VARDARAGRLAQDRDDEEGEMSASIAETTATFGAELSFAIGETSLGAVLVARSAKGICAILIGDEPASLRHACQERFPRVRLIGDDAALAETLRRVVQLIEAPATSLDLPLDAQGSAFERRVWEALRDIPPGSTASYGEIARRLGAPATAQEVAAACAANPLAVAVPCHRVVKADGTISGYRWGVRRKRALLSREAAA
jgi:O-6-methylguanine DNA methyltransferase